MMRLGVGASAALALAALARPVAASDGLAAPGPAETSAAAAAPETVAAAAPVASRWDYAFIPLVFYAPETSLGIALGVAIYEDNPGPPDKPRRDDSLAMAFQGTLRKQFTVSLSGVKFWSTARYQLTEDAAFLHFPNIYWGLGNDTPETARDPFTQSGAVSRATFATRIFEEVYAGAGLSAGWYRTSDSMAGGTVDAYLTATAPGGSAVGAGPVLRRDTRDDAIGPHNGSLTSLSATFFPSVLGTSYRFQSYELDHRTYVALGSRSVLAMEAYGLYMPGNVPIAELPALGGNSRLRGYFQGRYRDHLYVMGQLEWRVRVWGRFSVAPFVGVGNVFPSPSAMSFERTKVAGGLAVRFNLKKERELNVHIDVAVSPTSSGVYLNMGEAF